MNTENKDETMTPQEFYQLLSQQGIELTDRQKDQFERYFELLVEWNEKNQSDSYHREKMKSISNISMIQLRPFCKA